MPMPEPAAQQGPALAAGANKFGSVKELKAKLYVATVITQPALDFLIVCPSAEKCEAEDLEWWAHNPSTSRRTPIDSGSFVVGLEIA